MIFIPLPKTNPSPLPPPSSSKEAPSNAAQTASARVTVRRRSGRSSIRPRQQTAASPPSSAEPSTSMSREPSATASSVNTSTRSTPDINVPSSAVSSEASQRDLARVWEAVSNSRRIVVVCGAGISVSQPAGIPDFRSSTGLFKSLKEQHPEAGLTSGKDLFDARLFQSEANTALFYSMIASLHNMTVFAKPTLFHHLLKRLDEQGRLQRVYTQNIDALEERAGLTFGLGEGAGRLFKKTASLGKRKRAVGSSNGVHASSELDGHPVTALRRRAIWSKSQSAPNVSPLPSPSLFGPSPEPSTAMFPRVIPLHGSLANLLCTACDHKMATLPTLSEDVTTALKSLADGEPPVCPACSERDDVRLAAGLRSRGIGFLKPDVVLYNGDNKSGERVGECLERDVLGLRDPLDGKVPETFNERNLRKKRANKEAEKEKAAFVIEETEVSQSMMSIGTALESEDVLGKVFEEDEQDEEEEDEGRMIDCLANCSMSGLKARPRKGIQRAVTQPAPTAMVKQVSKSSSDAGSASAGSSSSRNARLKPLPPDLLIVAGTSLKVPGTKRVVREFAKAARARDGIVPKGCKSRRNAAANDARERSNTPPLRSRSHSRMSPAGNESESDAAEGSGEEGAREDGSNPHRPIRTILLNYDFPVPSREWESIFDVWIQGDVQVSAGGLWTAAHGYGMGKPLHAGDESEEEGAEQREEEVIEGCQSWHIGMDELNNAREAIKKSRKNTRVKQSVVGEDNESASSTTTSPKKSRRFSAGASRKSSTSGDPSSSAESRLRALQEEEPVDTEGDVDMTETSVDYNDGSSPVIKVTSAPKASRSPQKPKTAGGAATTMLKRAPSKKMGQLKMAEGVTVAVEQAGLKGLKIDPKLIGSAMTTSQQTRTQIQPPVDKSFTAVKRRNSVPSSSSSTSVTEVVNGRGKGKGKDGGPAPAVKKEGLNGVPNMTTTLGRRVSLGRGKKTEATGAA